MPEGNIIALVAGTFLLAGTVKGVIGLGLPTVSLAILSVAIDLYSAMALLLVPSAVTNLWQAMVGGNGKLIVVRIWPFLLLATVMVWVGAEALTRIEVFWLAGLLGVVLVGYSGINLIGFHFTLDARQESWAGPVMGAVNGILTGMTGSFVVPGVMFLQAIGLARDQFIQAMGMLFTLSTLALAGALQGNGLLSARLGMWSAAAVVPAILGMMLGQHIRRNITEKNFRKIFFAALLLSGLYIIVNAYQNLLRG